MPAVNCANAPAPTFLCRGDVRLLVTRPELDAERTAAVLRECNHAVLVAPLLRIEPISDVEIPAGRFAAILVTSANAAAAIEAHSRLQDLQVLPVFAAGDRSAEAMRVAGFAPVTSAGGDVNHLVELVTEQVKPGAALLYLAAGERAGDLAGDLRGRGYRVQTAIVYRAIADAPLLPGTVRGLTAHGIDGVLHFSRRSAQAFIDAARAAGVLVEALKPIHFCLSAQVAEPLRQAGATDVRIAPDPTEAALLAIIPRF
jgi:uroporphyrinogen-III synthase